MALWKQLNTSEFRVEVLEKTHGSLETIKHFRKQNIYKPCLSVSDMDKTLKIKRYGNTAVIRLKKEDMEHLEKEGIVLGDCVDISIKRNKHLNTSGQKKL